jgi:MFS family permease
MYCVSLMDRTNLSVANVAGYVFKPTLSEAQYANAENSMEDDLLLKVGYRYSIATLVFFPTYIIFQIPSTIIVRAIGPRIHLGTITIIWGGLMIAMGFVKDWQALAGLRVLLGVLEAGFFPSCVYLLSTWYTRCKCGMIPAILMDTNVV